MRSRIIQKLDTGVDAGVSNRSSSEIFLANGTIAIGDWVQLDSTAATTDRAFKVIEASAGTATGNPLVIGVALSAATSGQTVRVCVAGYCATANVDAAVAGAGVALIVDNTGAGIANAIAAADTAPACGVSLAASAAGVAPVIVFANF